MAFPVTGTKITNLVNPEVYADLVAAKLASKLVFGAVTTIDRTLEGIPGDSIYVPTWAGVSDAVALTEGNSLTPLQMSATATKVTVVQYASAAQLSDRAIISGLGDPLNAAAEQSALSLSGALDGAIYTILHGMTAAAGNLVYTNSSTELGTDDINDALVLFGETVDDERKFLYCDAKLYAALRKANDWLPASQLAAEVQAYGAVGYAYGCFCIPTNRIAYGGSGSDESVEAFIVKENAFRTFLKRDVNVEFERDTLSKSTIVSADIFAAQYLYNIGGAIKLVGTGTP